MTNHCYLKAATEIQQHLGMGIKIPTPDSNAKGGGEMINQFAHLFPSIRDNVTSTGNILTYKIHNNILNHTECN